MHKHTIVFCTEELYPITAGGLGRFMFNVSKILYTDFNLILIIPNIKEEQVHNLKQQYSFFQNIEIITKSIEIKMPYWDAKGKFFRDTILSLAKTQQIGLVEFYDFGGTALELLFYRQAHPDKLKNVKIWVRHHMTIGEISKIEHPHIPNPLTYYIQKREQQAIQAADGVFVQAQSTKHTIKNNNCIVSYPPVEKMKSFYNENNYERKDILYFGKIQQCKNIEVLIESIVNLLDKGYLEDLNRCIIVGHIVPNSYNVFPTYQDEIFSLIPLKYKHKFLFLGPWDLDKLPDIAKNTKFAVLPSKIESFCLAAHELASGGMPMILNNLPVYKDFFENNTLFFENNMQSLSDQILAAWEDKKLLLAFSHTLKTIEYPDKKLEYQNVLNQKTKPNMSKIKVIKYNKILKTQSYLDIIFSKNIKQYLFWVYTTKQYKIYIKKILGTI